ncbi:hypothetical protein QZM81_28475 [Burkholderia cepacia]|uniref:Histidine kinase n=1 Tax=Burkholderia cepacia TaxID=292 RepID=A0AAQ0FAY0_BURCE|nr:hypothetical protein [Burkholderia cepacia]MDN7859745.1 hypothetical protein [Burkholderia cepacia]RAQ07470.1 hypothetical protein DPR02_19775 [Burkholderia cepacia]
MTVHVPAFKAGPAPRRVRPARSATLATLLTLALGLATSFGLVGIRERAHMLDGTVTIDNRPGTGFTIAVALPLHAIRQGDVLS